MEGKSSVRPAGLSFSGCNRLSQVEPTGIIHALPTRRDKHELILNRPESPAPAGTGMGVQEVGRKGVDIDAGEPAWPGD